MNAPGGAFAGTIEGTQENPPQTTPANGTVAITYNSAAKTVDLHAHVFNLAPGLVTGYHIHRAQVGVNGPIIVDLAALFGLGALIPDGAGGFTFDALGVALPPQHEAAFVGGITYFNVHTAAAPGGLIRGQIFPSGVFVAAAGTATGTGGISNIEDATGGSAADSLVGSIGVNTLSGNDGNDTIVGGPGNDTLLGGNNNDTLVWSNGDNNDIIDGGVGADIVVVNGAVAAGDVFTVGANGSRVAFARLNLVPFTLDIGTTETLIVNGLGGNDTTTVNSLAGVANLTALNLNGQEGDDTFNVLADAAVTINVNGGSPIAPTLPGDTLNFNAAGPVIVSATSLTALGQQPVNRVSIETLNLNGNIVVDGTAGADTFLVKRNGDNLDVRLNGTLIDSRPFASLTTYALNGSTGNEIFNLDFSGGVGAAGNVIPPGGFSVNGGGQTGPPGDALNISGGAQGTVTYNCTNATDGTIVLSAFGTVHFTGLAPVSVGGPLADLIVNLPAGPSVVTLDDDGTPANGMSRLSSSPVTFEQLDFANPSGSLTINRGNALDTLTVNALPDFTASLTNGTAANPFATLTFGGAVALAAGKNLTAYSSATITLTGTANLSTSGAGAITLFGDRMAFAVGAVINAPVVSLSPNTPAWNVDLGSAVDTTASTLELSDSELDVITAGTLIIGDANSGPITVSAPISPANVAALSLVTPGTIADTFTSGTDVTVASLTTSNNLAPGASPGIFSVAGNHTLAANSAFAVEIGGITPGNGPGFHDQLSATASVDIGANVTLNVLPYGGFVPSPGQSFMIISRTGGSGAFNGLAEGAIVSANFLSSSFPATISYLGGSGDDVVLTVNQGSTTTGLASSLSPSVFGQSVTFAATVSPVAPAVVTPTGTVSFYDGSAIPANLLGTVPLVAGVASFSTAALSTTGSPHVITAQYAGDANYTTSSGTTGQTVNPAATTTVLASSVNPSVSGQPVTFTATVTAVAPGAGTPTGTVPFMDGVNNLGTVALAGGVASVSTAALTDGAHSITAQYSGDASFTGSAGNTVNQVVNPLDYTVTTTGNAIVVTDVAGNGDVLTVSEPLATEIKFAAPGRNFKIDGVTFITGDSGNLPLTGITSITVNAGVGADVIDVGAFTGTLPSLTINGGTGDDTVNLNADIAFAAGQSLVVNAESLNTGAGADLTTSVAGGITITADDVALDATSTLVSASTVTFQPQTASRPINLGTETAGSLSLSDAELDVITAGTLVIGDANSGNITISAPITLSPAQVAALRLVTPGTIADTFAGGTDVTIASLTTSGTLAPGASPGLFSVAGNYAFADNSALTVEIGGTTPGTEYDQLSASGSVDLGANVTLNVAAFSGFVPSPGQSFMIISRTGGSGTFAGLLEGATVSANFLGCGFPATISYVGGSGDDVVITVLRGVSTTFLASAPNPSVFGQAVTLTATVSPVAPAALTPTGTVQFRDGATVLGSAPLIGGVASFPTSVLLVGPHALAADYLGDANFLTSGGTTAQTVNPAATITTVASSVNPSVFGQPVTFTATVAAAAPGAGIPSGMVTFKDGATPLGTIVLNGAGQATLSTATLAIGNHPMTVEYAGSTDFTASASALLSQTVNAAPTTTTVETSVNPSVFGQSVTFTATVAAAPPGAGLPSGLVTFMDGANTLGVVPLNGLGQATLSTGTLAVGDHPILAAYGGDAHFLVSISATTNQTVNAAATTTTVASSVNPTVFGQAVTFTATVTAAAPGTGIPGGMVTFKDGVSPLGTVVLNGVGQATLTTAALAIGNHPITVEYAGSTDFTASVSAPLNQTVNFISTTTTLVTSNNPSFFYELVSFTARVAAVPPGVGIPSGLVIFFADGNMVGVIPLDRAGEAVVSFALLAVGDHPITAFYFGDASFQVSPSMTITQTVIAASSTTTVASSANPSYLGQPVTFAATVTAVPPSAGTPGGLVTFKAGATVLGTGVLNSSGQATLTTAVLAMGNHPITVEYAGITNFTPSASAPLNQTVNSAATITTVAASTNPSRFGQSVTFLATVAAVSGGAGIPSGTVVFRDGATVLGIIPLNGAGQAALSTAALAVGNHPITVAYGGDGSFQASISATTSQTVNAAATTTTVASSADPSVFGQSVSFIATVAAVAPGAGIPSGTVTFKDGASVLGTIVLNGAGQATVTTAALAIGNHPITAEYAGSTDFTASASAPLNQTVNSASTTTTVETSVNPSVFGQPVTFNATVAAVPTGAGIPSGLVTFMAGTNTLGIVPLNGLGQATFGIAALAVGNHPIIATYGGDVHFLISISATATQIVSSASTTTTVASSANPSVFGQSATFSATVAAVAPGAGIPSGTVTFKDGATPLGTIVLNGAGQATVTTAALAIGNHPITAEYAGSTDFTASASAPLNQTVNSASTATTVTSTVNPSFFGQSVTFTATVAAVSPGAGIPSGTVTFKDGATPLGTIVLNGAGQATVTTAALAIGNHPITVEYAGSTDFTAGTSAPLNQAVNSAATTTTVTSTVNPSVFGQSVTFTATVAAVAPGTGIPSGAVTFKDGATVLGSGALNGSGQAILSTAALTLGTHVITAQYADTGTFGASTGSVAQVVGNLIVTDMAKLNNGAFWLRFTAPTGLSNSVLASPNAAWPLNTWSNLGSASETPPGSGQFQFTDVEATNYPQRFYRVRSP